MQKAAFFDIDRTFYPGILAVDLVERLKLNPTVRDILAESGLDGYSGVVEVLQALQRSGRMPYELYCQIAKEVADHAAGRFYKYTLDLFKECRKSGYCMVAMSQAPFLVLKEFCNQIDGDSFDVVISPMPTTKLRGELLVLGESSVVTTSSRDKADWLKKISDCYGFNLSLSLAIGDSASDIRMLEAVGGRRIAFNPDAELESAAKLNGWEIIQDIKLKEGEG